MLDLIEAIWVQNPDLRLMQLFHAVAMVKSPGEDLFDIEDADLATRLKAIFLK